MKILKDTLKDLVELHGAPGFEQDIKKYIESELKEYNIKKYFTDNIGNFLVEIKGSDPDAPIIHLDAHMDEPCFMVKYIDEEGFIYIVQLGCVEPNVMNAQRVIIKTKKGPVCGAFGTKSFHLISEEERKSKELKFENMWIDVGVDSREKAAKLGIKPGLPVTFDVKMKELENDYLMAKAFDNRVGCVVLLETAKHLLQNISKSTIYLSFSVQEEVCLRGCIPIYRDFKQYFGKIPKISIVYDICLAGDFPGVVKHKAPVKLGKGPGIKVYDRSNVTHYSQIVPRKLVEALEEIAKENDIPYQFDFLLGSTNADVFSLENTGVIAGGIGIPCRYTHTPIEMINLKDVENAIKLTLKFIKECPKYFNN